MSRAGGRAGPPAACRFPRNLGAQLAWNTARGTVAGAGRHCSPDLQANKSNFRRLVTSSRVLQVYTLPCVLSPILQIFYWREEHKRPVLKQSEGSAESAECPVESSAYLGSEV